MTSQADKAAAFQVHAAPGAFVIPNPWDAGTAKMLALAGYRAAREIAASGRFGFLQETVPFAENNGMFE